MKTQIESYIAQFNEIHHGEPWFGESLQTLFSDIPYERAVAAVPGKSNIIRLLWHCIKWRQSLLERLKGTPNYRARVEDPDNWLSYDDPKMSDWSGAIARFEEQHTEITILLAEKDDSILLQEFFDASTYKTLIEGVIQHDIYHFGQIALLNSILKG